MARMPLRALLSAAVLLAAGPSGAEDARTLLARTLSLDDADWREADAGGVAVRVLETPHRREVAAVALVRTRAGRDAFLAAAADPAHLAAANPDVTAAGALEASAGGIQLDEREAAALAACRPGACAVKLDDATLARLAREVDWRAPGARAQAAAVLRERRAEIAHAYRREGVSALPTVHDRTVAVDTAARARELLERTPRLSALAPALARHFDGYPRADPAVVRETLFWSREAFWRRQVLSLGHLAAAVPDGGPMEAVVAARQLDADHYFEAALTVTALVADGDRRYLVRLYRFETDHKGGGFNFLERALVRRSARKRLERQMTALRTLAEAPHGVRAAP